MLLKARILRLLQDEYIMNAFVLYYENQPQIREHATKLDGRM
jgi:hypothetical protein